MMFAGHGVGTPGIDNVKLGFIRGKRDPIRLVKILGNCFEISGLGIIPENVTATIFALGNVPLVIRKNPIGRISKPYGSIRFDDNIVRRVQLLALELIHKNRDRTVWLSPSHPPGSMFASHSTCL